MEDWTLAYSASARLLMWAPLVALLVVGALVLTFLADARSRPATSRALAVIAVGMFIVQAWLALAWAPPERYMGDTGRILYLHVPLAIMSMVALCLNFGASVVFLVRRRWGADSLAESSAVIGVLFGALGLALGAIWAKPTWGTWWTWDPRLTTNAILVVVYAGYLALRRFVDEPEKRATWSAVVAIFAAVDIPLTYFSVRWWRSMHQVQSNPSTVDPQMVMVLRWSYTMFLALLVVLLYQRYRLAVSEREREVAPPAP